MHFLPVASVLLLPLAALVQAISWTATPFNPSSIPLAVRTPYLSAWLPQGAGAALNDVWATFWTGMIVGWAGFVKVDGVPYVFLGAPTEIPVAFSKAVQKSSRFTSTQSIFVLSAGLVDITVTFLSPVEANDLVKQSIPFAYMAVSAASTDGRSHSVQVFSDITGEWVSGDNSLAVNWTTTTGVILTHQVQLQNPAMFTELNDHTQYGSTVGATYQTGSFATVRAQFITNGKLANTLDSAFRAISNNWPVFGFAHDLGTITSATTPVVFSVGLVRDPAVQYIIAGGALQSRNLYFLSSFPTVDCMIASFLSDFGAALLRAQALDAQIQADAGKISADYAGVVALSIRQAFAATELTISKTSTGGFNTSDIILFMKGESWQENHTWPVFLYMNPALGKYLLEGLFRYQASGQYPNKWSIHDLGANYPNALGHNDGGDLTMPLEETGNMIIMALSYAQKSGDISQLTSYSALLDQWAQFLVADSLLPFNQISTDVFAGSLANQTNLAIKGIVGLGAMAKIELLLGTSAQSANYSSIAASYVTQWQHSPLFGDKLLQLNLFPASVYAEQTAWYQTHANAFGVPLDTRHTYTMTDWEIFTAAWVTDTGVRDILISAVKNWVSNGRNNAPFGDLYDTVSGTLVSIGPFRARPVVGGHLALQKKEKKNDISSTQLELEFL
ncbi:DUF1793-domain-containing protein [Mycena leptocephala]|nr:DUF1793-domain-containing protein [Mycena leptocephala]